MPVTRPEWQDRLANLPGDHNHIPAFFFAHGSPVLNISKDAPGLSNQLRLFAQYSGLESPFANFLRDFGPALLSKYQPKGILVFSAHWESDGEELVTDYGEENPLLMDYYNFSQEFYKLKFSSRGDARLSQRVVELFDQADIRARVTSKDEARGRDGRGFQGPGLDHGVFIPFRLMFGEDFRSVPIVEASIDGTLSPERNWSLGKAVAKLREEGILVLSGGLTVHNLQDLSSFIPETANPSARAFSDAVSSAISISDPVARKTALLALTQHKNFRDAHPREDHFVPIYVAAGAGEDGNVHVLSGLYGCQTVAFGS